MRDEVQLSRLKDSALLAGRIWTHRWPQKDLRSDQVHHDQIRYTITLSEFDNMRDFKVITRQPTANQTTTKEALQYDRPENVLAFRVDNGLCARPQHSALPNLTS